jgi:hypothetical protein
MDVNMSSLMTVGTHSLDPTLARSQPTTVFLTTCSIMRKLLIALKTFICVMAIVLPLAVSFFAWRAYKYFTTKITADPKQPPQTRRQRAIAHVKSQKIFSYDRIQSAVVRVKDTSQTSFQTQLAAYKPTLETFLARPSIQDNLCKLSACIFGLATVALLSSRVGSWYNIVAVLALFQASDYLKTWADVLQRKRIEELEGEIEGLKLRVVGDEGEGWDICGKEE